MTSTFAVLLRRFRISAELSQEALAEAASISASAVGAYDRGLRAAPHRETVAQLAKVLGLDETQRVEFESAARRKRRSPGALAAPSGAVVDEPNRFALDNLPLETTSFVGRAIELEEIGKLLSEYRIVTLTGMGGIGKTRIALNVASRLRGTRRDGVWFIGFGTLSNWALVVPTVAAALGLATPTVATLRHDCVRGARLLGFVNRNIGAFRELTEKFGYKLLMASLRLQRSDEAIAALEREGEALAYHAAVGEALDVGT